MKYSCFDSPALHSNCGLGTWNSVSQRLKMLGQLAYFRFPKIRLPETAGFELSNVEQVSNRPILGFKHLDICIKSAQIRSTAAKNAGRLCCHQVCASSDLTFSTFDSRNPPFQVTGFLGFENILVDLTCSGAGSHGSKSPVHSCCAKLDCRNRCSDLELRH